MKKIKLTEESLRDMIIYSLFTDEDVKQILDNQEKAEKLDKIKEFQDDLERENNHSDGYPEFIKEILDSQQKE